MKPATVYGVRLSPFVEKVVRGLELKGVPHRLVAPRTPLDLRRWNPTTRKMPVVEIEGEWLYDSTFILRRLDELVPDPPLFAQDARVAAAQRQLEDWCDESLYWYLMALRWTERNAAASGAQVAVLAPRLLRPLMARLAIHQIGSMPRVQGLGRLPEEVLVRECGARLDDLVVLLGSRPFFFADRPSAADLALYGMLQIGVSGPTPEMEQLLSERPRLGEWKKRVEEATGG